MNPQPEVDSVYSGDPALGLEQPQPAEPSWLGIRQTAWLQLGILAALFAFTFYQASLRRLWLKTNPINGEPNWSHAVCVPIIGLYYLYANRRSLLACTVREGWSALPVLIAGLLLFGYGIYPGQNDMVKDLGMVLTVFGLTAFLLGWEIMKIVWFPIAFMVCAIPWPGLVYSWVASPLQRLAADMAVAVLKVTGVAALGDGTKIIIDGEGGEFRTLNVAEACAGLRSLMTFMSVAAAVAFLSNRALWQKIVITLSAIPIAIFCNVARVTGQGFLHRYVDERLSQSFAHAFIGLIMLIPAFFLILLVGWLLDNLFMEEAELGSGGVRRSAEALVVQRSRKSEAAAPKPVAPVQTVVASVAKPTAPKPAVAKPAAPKPAAAAAPQPSPAPKPAAAPAGVVRPAPKAPRPAVSPAPNSLAAATARLTTSRIPPRPVNRPAAAPPRAPGAAQPAPSQSPKPTNPKEAK